MVIKYIRPLSSLSADDLVQIQRAAQACQILPGLLIECVLRHDYRLLPAVQWRRLEAYLADERARQAYESIFAEAEAAEDLRRTYVQSRDGDQSQKGGDS